MNNTEIVLQSIIDDDLDTFITYVRKIFPSLTITNLIIEYNRLTFIQHLYYDGYKILHVFVSIIKRYEKDNNKDRNEILRFLHDKGVKYNWRCPNCIHCNKAKKEKIQEEWYMESKDYNSIIQWLPREMVEDTLVLL